MIDCEHHVLAGSLDELVPFVDNAWSHRMTTSEFRLPSGRPHPGVQIEGGELATPASPAEAAAALPDAVKAALLVPAQPMAAAGWLSGTMSMVFARAVNDFVVSTWLPADKRFRFALAVSPHDAQVSADEIRRLGEDDRCAAICLPLTAISMGQRHYHPIYEAASELRLPVIVHPSGFEGFVVGPAALGGVGPRTPEETFSLLPQVAMANLSSLVFDGVFERFPELRVVFAGFGFSWAVPVLWRMDSEWRGLRVEVPWLTRSPAEVVRDHVRFVVDAACELRAEAWQIAQMLPEGVLLYGSDRPFVDDAPEARLAGAPADRLEQLSFANAEATFSRMAA
jgi:predicted TIM-barrel fold metal-dependent hydrolase